MHKPEREITPRLRSPSQQAFMGTTVFSISVFYRDGDEQYVGRGPGLYEREGSTRKKRREVGREGESESKKPKCPQIHKTSNSCASVHLSCQVPLSPTPGPKFLLGPSLGLIPDLYVCRKAENLRRSGRTASTELFITFTFSLPPSLSIY
jgi:hypothetical protein